MLQAPKSLALEMKSGDIYIADALNSRIQVFDRNLDYSFHFPTQDFKYPWGICIKDYLVFTTQKNDNKIKIFHLDGTYITGRENSESMVKYNAEEPMGIAVDYDNSTFICDSGNRRILVLQPTLPIVTDLQIGDVVPVDVKMHRHHLVVLTTNNLTSGNVGCHCSIKILFRSGEFFKEIKLSEVISKSPQFLAIDRFDNLFVTSPELGGSNISRTGVIYIYGWDGKLIKKLANLFKNIKGIAVDKNCNIINVCEIDVGRLKIL